MKIGEINFLFILAYIEGICNNIGSHIKTMRYLGLYRAYNPKVCPELDGRDTKIDFEHYDF
jgi:hypothetical protein